jgi:hypothetical protein
MPNDSPQEIKQKSSTKIGKTLLVKALSESFDLDTLDFDKFQGMVSQNVSQSSNTIFLVFESTSYALAANTQLKSKMNYKNDFFVKFPRYSIFFTLEGLNEDYSYDDVRKEHIKFIQDNTNAKVFNYKLYRKSNAFIGCGEVSIDLKDGMDKLIDKNGELKNYSLDSGKLTGIFYRFNKRVKPNSPQENGEICNNIKVVEQTA